MEPTTAAGAKASPKALVWTGRVISGLLVLALIMSGAMKFSSSPDVVKGFSEVEWKIEHAKGLGILEITCAVLYAIPQTAVFGAILLTGYMGGAIATHARQGDDFYIQAGIGVLVWLGLYLRESRLWTLLPLRR